MNIREIAQTVWSEQDVKDMLANIMDIAKGGSIKHAEFVYKVMTYEPRADAKGQLQIPFENDITVKIVRSGTPNDNNI